MKRFSLILSIAFLSLSLLAQDTLTMLQYNLLNYGNNTGYCNSGNNNISDKDNYIKTIVNYIKPDIFTVNEISESPAIHQRLLDNALNTGSTTHYRLAETTNQAGSYIVNELYYNYDKLRFYSVSVAQNYIRDANVYKLYYYSSDLAQGDTVFINCIVTHLKAGSGTDNSNKRKIMAQNIMNWVENHDDETNFMLMGDFNVYTDEEPAIMQFLYNSNSSIRFNDPVNRLGPWNNNSNYADVHTQSTHASSNDCASGGGMDDRFDFILISNDVKNGTHDVSYIPGTYHAVGQDGKHFNKSVNSSPTNTSVPSDVLNALYHNSDHLPVTMKIKVNKTVGISEWKNSAFAEVGFANPVGEKLKLTIEAKETNRLTLQIFSLTGAKVFERSVDVVKGTNYKEISLPGLNKGLYVMKFYDNRGNVVVKKFVR